MSVHAFMIDRLFPSCRCSISNPLLRSCEIGELISRCILGRCDPCLLVSSVRVINIAFPMAFLLRYCVSGGVVMWNLNGSCWSLCTASLNLLHSFLW